MRANRLGYTRVRSTLVAARRAVQRPLAELLAVVAEQTIAVLASTRAGAPNHFRGIEAGILVEPHAYAVSMSEACERNLFHRSPTEVMCEGTVVHDLSPADVDAVMGKARTRCNEVRGAASSN